MTINVHTEYQINVPYCLKLWPGCLFLSSNFSPRPLNEAGNYTRMVFINWSSKSKFYRLWILMAAGDTRAADPVGTVHHEMDRAVRSHHFYKSVYAKVFPFGCFPIYGSSYIGLTWEVYTWSERSNILKRSE